MGFLLLSDRASHLQTFLLLPLPSPSFPFLSFPSLSLPFQEKDIQLERYLKERYLKERDFKRKTSQEKDIPRERYPKRKTSQQKDISKKERQTDRSSLLGCAEKFFTGWFRLEIGHLASTRSKFWNPGVSCLSASLRF